MARINLLRHTQRVTDELLDNMTRESNLAMLKNAAKDWNAHIVGDSPLPEVVLEGDYYSHFDERGGFDLSETVDQSMSRDLRQERKDFFNSRNVFAESSEEPLTKQSGNIITMPSGPSEVIRVARFDLQETPTEVLKALEGSGIPERFEDLFLQREAGQLTHEEFFDQFKALSQEQEWLVREYRESQPDDEDHD